jgi:CarD family transcriptional regulator
MSKQYSFNIGDYVVYPTHGVGKILSEEIDNYGGVEIKVYVITFENNNMTLRIPQSRAIKVGLRPLCSNEFLNKALDVLSGKKIKLNKGMWSKRVQQYETKINSGNVVAIAEVIKELHSNVEKSERSYSEKIIYNDALERLAGEYAAMSKVELEEAINKINDKLN